MTKKCTKCGEVKAFNEFYRTTCRKDGRQSNCKKCRGEYTKKNKQKIRKYKKIYREKNKVRINEFQRKYRKENKGKIKAFCRRYRENHRDKINSTNKNRINELSDCYVKFRICTGTNLTNTDIPPELTALKREHLKLTRQIKQRST